MSYPVSGIRLKLALAALPCLLVWQAQASEVATATHTELHDCVIQEVLPGKDMTGAYLRIVHKGAPVQMLKADVPSVSPRVELHSMEMKNDVMQMREMTDLQVPEGERVFKKGGDHVMLFEVTQKPAIGSRHTLSLYFSDNTKASCQAEVKAFKDLVKDAAAHGQHGQHGHKH